MIIAEGEQLRGIQLPIQSKSPTFVQPWELEAGPAELARIAQAADETGLGYVAVCDHVAIPADVDIGTTWYDTVATLGWLAALCPNTWLMSHVYVLPYRHPLMVAKSFVTLDRLSGGRVILGVGAGHVADEFAVLGADYEHRGPDLAAAIDYVRTAFAAASEDELLAVEYEPDAEVAVGIGPAPARPGGPPIWVGGSSSVAIERAATLGDGWLPQGPPKEGMRAAIARIRARREEAGLDPADFAYGVNCEPIRLGDSLPDQPEYTLTGSGDFVADRLGRYEALGCNQLQLRFLARSVDDHVDQLHRFAEEVAPRLPPSPSAGVTG